MSKFFAVFTLLFFLTGCETLDIELFSTPAQVQIEDPPLPRPVVMRDVQWMVLNRERLEILLEESNGSNFAVFALTPDGYENLALNINELRRYLEQQREIIIYYRNVSENIQNRLDNEENNN